MKKPVLSVGMFCSMIFISSAEIVKTGKNVSVTGTGNAMRVQECELEVAVHKGAALTITPGTVPVVVHSDDASITLNNGSSWRDKVVFWLDASAEDSFSFEKVGDKPDGAQCTVDWGGVQRPTINRWYDCRGKDRPYYALNQRGLAYATDKTFKSVMPFLMKDDNDGLAFVSFGNYQDAGRRMTLHRTDCPVDDYNSEKESKYRADVQFKFAAVVFGSQRGGGASIVYPITRGNYTSGGPAPVYTDPIFADDYPTWVDGVSVDATKIGFENKGWYCISFSSKNGESLSATGLCYSFKNSTAFGGGNYREIIFLSEMPTEGERHDLEQYLANKWKTKAIPAMPTPTAATEVRLFGTGTASVPSGSVALGGEFSGTVTVAEGATLVMTAEKSAPAAPASIGDSAATALHYDPNIADSIKKYWNEPNANSVGCLYESREIGMMDNVLYGSSRTPTWTKEVRGFGPENVWLSYDHTKTLDQVGCTLRLGNKETADGQAYNFRTGFMVLDTSAGGGTPFLATSIDGADKYLFPRTASDSSVFAISSGSAEEFVKNVNDIRLNGNSDGQKWYARYFNSRPEVMSVSFDGDVPLRCLGYYKNLDGDNMLIHGEAIFYARELTEAERCDTEAYLMKKWLGLTPSGYGDPLSTTIDGAGSVILANHVDHPKFAPTFTGSVAVPNSVLKFRFKKDEQGKTVAVNAINAPSAAITTPASIVVRLSSEGFRSLDGGDYTLIDCAGWTGGETVALEDASLSSVSLRGAALIREGNRLVLRIKKFGFVFMVK